jgi:two-component SAPR family response regulator
MILKKNINLLKEMLLEFKPDAILYDVSIPYDENWKFFRKISNFEEAKNIKFILTSTNKRNLEKIVGPTNSIEILGKPFDLEELAKAIKIATNRA